jgi:type VI secretion system protein ImpF
MSGKIGGEGPVAALADRGSWTTIPAKQVSTPDPLDSGHGEASFGGAFGCGDPEKRGGARCAKKEDGQRTAISLQSASVRLPVEAFWGNYVACCEEGISLVTARGQTVGLAASLLDRLVDDDPRAGDPRVDPLDLKQPAQLAQRLQDSQQPLCRYIREQADPADRHILDQYQGSTPVPQPVMAAIVDCLNRVILGPFLYERRRCDGVTVSPDLVRLMEDSRKNKYASPVNRRLLDEVFREELAPMRQPTPPSLSLRELKASVARDIEALLNTRRQLLFDVDPELAHVRTSILMFGLPDFTSYSLLNPADRKTVRRAVEDALTDFEPRLKSVRVTLEARDTYDMTLRFRIDALLRTDPAPEPITLDAALHVVTSQYTVREDR